ncbi:pirin family protein [Lutibacter sp. HS1-25]|uniref:pirin family protein n=1 Tax=Lutibacter sp. HS1-25 TaxID=2485000 RepID=UPI001012328A|nr:pirin family protein [Lutibacter sp. HS1-25]RXP63594.1 pirin family protein [Lutibacter sp. HS1-25]
MKTKIYKSQDRGTANYGWLKANYSFSFANYFNPEAINFGALRVLNDDIIDGGMGFGTHPHNNMEIITIPLKGSLKHKDSMTNKWIPIHAGEVQVMSAGSGVQHSEMNNHPTEEINLFQIWILPNKENVTPRYEQKKFEASERKNNLQILVSSIDNPIEGSLKIHQNAQISRIILAENETFKCQLSSEFNGVYTMLIDGEIDVNNEILKKRDAIGIEQTASFEIKALQTAEILFIEVPMKF